MIIVNGWKLFINYYHKALHLGCAAALDPPLTQSKLTQGSSHNYVVIVTSATTGWTKKMYLKKTSLFHRYIFCVYSVDIYSFFVSSYKHFK